MPFVKYVLGDGGSYFQRLSAELSRQSASIPPQGRTLIAQLMEVDGFGIWLGLGFLILLGLMLFIWMVAFNQGLKSAFELQKGELLHPNGDIHIQSFARTSELLESKWREMWKEFFRFYTGGA
jgi:hypothetical protein